MIQQTLVTVWFLLSSSFFICFSSTPLSTIHKFNTRERQRHAGQEVDVALLSTLYYFKRSKRDERGGLYLLQTSHSLPGPNSQLITSGVSRKKEDGNENTDSMGVTNPLTINASNAVSTAMTALTTASTTTNITIATSTTTTASVTTNSTIPYPTVPTSPYSPHSFPSLSSSCFSPACKWLASWHFIAVVSLTVTWLMTLMILYFMTRTAWGGHLLEGCSSLCTCERQDKEEDQVLAKGIGYFDGSPGMRRFVFIEDDADDEEEEDMKKEESDTEREETDGGNRISKKWKPPRQGTYILQEASKKDVLEIGTYRIQEKEEEEEVNGKTTRKKEDNEEEVEYILDGEAYLLQSERVERQGIGEERREEYEPIGGIEGLYGIVGREGVRGGGYRIRRLGKLPGVVGRGVGESRYGRTGEIDRLYELLKGEETEREAFKKVEGKRGQEDGVLMSVRELERAVRGNIGEEKSTHGRRDSENWKEEREDIHIEQERGSGSREMNKGVAEGGREKGKIGMEQRGRGGRVLKDTWEGRRRGGRANCVKDEEEMWGGLSPPTQKRAASFPMDHFIYSQFMSRKLSLIMEEETH